MDNNKHYLTISTYALKTGFQALLVPVRDWFIRHRISANQVTIATAICCIGYALLLVWPLTRTFCLVLLPLFLLLRMVFNALDGMIAMQTQTKSSLGTVLNEIGDVLSDVFLFGAFIYLLPSDSWPWLVLIVLCLLIEFVSLAIHMAIGQRPNLGPFSKSDRALYLGLLSILLFVVADNSVILSIYTGLGIALACLTLVNRLAVITRTAD